MADTRKRIVFRGMIFLAIFCLLFFIASEVFRIKPGGSDATRERVQAFYQLPQHSIDVLFIGASTLRNGISPLGIWGAYGVPSYTLASGYQNPLVSYYYLVEALKYQQPKVVVLDASWLIRSIEVDANETFLRLSVDPLRFSLNKLRLIEEIVSRSSNQTAASYLFPLLRYHARWKELTRDDLFFYSREFENRYKGQGLSFKKTPLSFSETAFSTTDRSARIDDEARLYYLKFIRLCEQNGIPVIMINTPRIGWDLSKHNAVKSFADKYGILYLDYSTPELLAEIGFNSSADFHDYDHLNIYGAQKVSNHLGAFLQMTFDLPDKRNDPAYAQWNDDLAAFQAKTGLK